MYDPCRRPWTVSAIASLLVALALTAPAAAADLQLSLRNGRVTLVARDVTVREILAEWARVGQTTIVNGETLAGGPIALEFVDVPERAVLDVLLRSAGGYVAATRPSPVEAASMYDRVIVMATTTRVPSSGLSPVAPPAFGNAFEPGPDASSPFGQPFQNGEPAPFGIPAPGTAPSFLGAPSTEPQDFEPADNTGSEERPYPSPFAQPLTPLLPGDAASQGTPPSAANPWGVPAGSSARPGMIAQPDQPPPAGRTP